MYLKRFNSEIYDRLLIVVILLFAVSAHAKQTVRFGVLALAPPATIYKMWQPFAEHLSQKTGLNIEIVVPRGYKKIEQAIRLGKVDLFYVNSYVFYHLKRKGHAVGLAQMKNLSGKITSASNIYVRRDSGIRNIHQLKGKTMAFISPMAAGGYLAPRAYLKSQGIKNGLDIRERFTNNVTNSIHGVLLKEYHASTMCGVKYTLMSEKINTGELIIIGTTRDYPENVFGARPELNLQTQSKVRKVILSLESSERGRFVLKKLRAMKIKQFVAYDPKLEKITRALAKEAGLL